MKTIAICNQKGGVGKTSTAVTMASFLGIANKRTLLIDLDPQGNSTSGLGINKNVAEKSAYHVLLNHSLINEVVVETQIQNLKLLPCDINLAGAEVELVNEMGREGRLGKALEKIKNDYDFVIIDCPPSLSMLTLNALTAAQSVLIPIQCEYYALEGLAQLIKTIDLVSDNLNPSLFIEGILMTMADKRTNLTDQVIQEVRKHFPDKVYDAVIPRSVKMSEAPGFGKPIMIYDKYSKVCKIYEAFTNEFLAKNAITS
ncbi:MAG: chromosome partitioning protein [Candidatus Omnitrophota bacterium]|jgi:chromosome partitioning protein